MRKTTACLTSILILLAAAGCAPAAMRGTKGIYDDMYRYSNSDGSFFVPYAGAYDEAAYPCKTLDAVFTADEIRVDGIPDGAWETAPPSRIGEARPLVPGGPDADTYGTLRALWNGPTLYLLAEVRKSSVVHGSFPRSGAVSGQPVAPSDRDSVCVGIELYNERTVYETDTKGVVNISADGELTYFVNGFIDSLSSVFAPENPYYVNRIESWAARDATDADGRVIGFNVELAVNIEGLGAENGKELSVEVQICSSDGTRRTENVFWSHAQDALYAELDHERPVNVDWGRVTLSGAAGKSEYAYSSRRLSEALRFLDSPAFQKGVYTEKTQKALDAARVRAENCLEAEKKGRRNKAEADRSAELLEAAIAGLRWADTRYPDPAELPECMTLPDPYAFFGSGRRVRTREDWPERREEILRLAQFYQYGFKPGEPDAFEVSHSAHFDPGDREETELWGMPWTVEYTCSADRFDIDVTVGSRHASLPFTVYLPTREQLASSGRTGRLPVVLSYDGDNPFYRDAGFAVAALSAGSDGDVRTTDYAWGKRGGCFYELYPYSRDGAAALGEVSSEMAAAWAATRTIDALKSLALSDDARARAVGEAIDPDRLAVTGFSINGKYAFAAAVFDERISVCIPGASGATGLSPWRYVYIGQEHDWRGTPFDSGDAAHAVTVAGGTETIGNSVRHNRVREIALFARFMTPRRAYLRLPGAYGYAARLPYDQTDLLATMAGRAVILMNTPNDYNDGSVSDALSMEIVRSVYDNLGWDGNELLRFNYRPVAAVGDPHGSDAGQYIRNAEYLTHYFDGTPLSPQTDAMLSTDPFALKISDGGTRSPYDYYWGGFNTVTGGSGGPEGRDGWYYYRLEDAPENTGRQG